MVRKTRNMPFTVHYEEPTGERGNAPLDETTFKLVSFYNYLNESQLAVFAGVVFILHGAGRRYGVG